MAQGAQGPPQSTSVSVAFLTASLHVGAAQTPPEQTSLWQSEPAVQVFPVAQGAQLGPPQSTSDSAPFFNASLQEGAAQTPAEQTALWQSDAATQVLPAAHGVQLGPPQSTSVSSPARTPSLQVRTMQSVPAVVLPAHPPKYWLGDVESRPQLAQLQ